MFPFNLDYIQEITINCIETPVSILHFIKQHIIYLQCLLIINLYYSKKGTIDKNI